MYMAMVIRMQCNGLMMGHNAEFIGFVHSVLSKKLAISRPFAKMLSESLKTHKMVSQYH